MLLLKCVCERNLGRAGAAVLSARRAFRLNPGERHCLIELCKSLYIQGQYNEVRDLIAQRNDRDGELLWIRGCCLEQLGKREEALDALVQAAQMLPQIRTKRRVARVQTELGQEAQALQTLRDILEFCPQNVDVLLELGVKLDQLDRADEAFSIFAEAAAVISPILQSQAGLDPTET